MSQPTGAAGNRIGIMTPADLRPELFGRFAVTVEQAGFDELWVPEDCFLNGGIAQAATALALTSRITVGLGILPAPARNVAFTALDLSFLACAHPGRLIAGIGHGVADWMRQVGALPASPLTLLAEYLDALRALLAGHMVTCHGEYVRLDGVRLTHVPALPPPVIAGVRGPKSLALSGLHADGTNLAEPVTPEYLAFAQHHIAATGPHQIVAYNVAAVDDDAASARERVRPALWWAGDPGWAAHLAPLPFAAELAARCSTSGTAAEFTQGLPDAWVDQLAVVGTPADARSRLATLHAAGASSVVLMPVGDDPVAAVLQLARVLP